MRAQTARAHAGGGARAPATARPPFPLRIDFGDGEGSAPCTVFAAGASSVGAGAEATIAGAEATIAGAEARTDGLSRLVARGRSRSASTAGSVPATSERKKARSDDGRTPAASRGWPIFESTVSLTHSPPAACVAHIGARGGWGG